MSAITDFLSGIGNAIATAMDFLGGIIADLVATAELLASGLAALPIWFGYFFPAEIVTPLLAIFAIVVIYKILGREG